MAVPVWQIFFCHTGSWWSVETIFFDFENAMICIGVGVYHIMQLFKFLDTLDTNCRKWDYFEVTKESYLLRYL